MWHVHIQHRIKIIWQWFANVYFWWLYARSIICLTIICLCNNLVNLAFLLIYIIEPLCYFPNNYCWKHYLIFIAFGDILLLELPNWLLCYFLINRHVDWQDGSRIYAVVSKKGKWIWSQRSTWQKRTDAWKFSFELYTHTVASVSQHIHACKHTQK